MRIACINKYQERRFDAMDTDVEWTWTIILRDGKIWHLDKPVSLANALIAFYDQGGQEAEIEALIRH